MKNLLLTPLFCLLCLPGLPVLAQDEAEQTENVDANVESETRQERIRELRQLLLEDRQARRAQIEQRLENLTDDEKAALRERRQLTRENQAQRMQRAQRAQRAQRIQRVQRAQRQMNRCDCAESESESTDLEATSATN